MYNKYWSLLLIFFLTSASCDLPDNTNDWYFTPSLFRLELDGYPYCIYQFSASSMYNDSNYSGHTILDTNQAFTLNEIKKLDFDFLKKLPTNDTLKIIKLVPPIDRLHIRKEPVRTTFKQQNDLTIQTEYLERYIGYSSVNSNAHWFSFTALNELPDSLIFYGIKSKYKTNLHQKSDSIVFPKKNLSLKFDRNGSPKIISAEVLIEEEADLYLYKKGSSVLESTIKGSFVRIKRSYIFTPSDSTVNMNLSFLGLFKQIK